MRMKVDVVEREKERERQRERETERVPQTIPVGVFDQIQHVIERSPFIVMYIECVSVVCYIVFYVSSFY